MFGLSFRCKGVLLSEMPTIRTRFGEIEQGIMAGIRSDEL
jgi:hypothetical protein